MFQAIPLGRAFGIPVRLHPTFFLLPLWALASTIALGLETILLTQAVLWTVFACVLLHELGHALAARWFGIGTRDITLYPIGGVARLDHTGGKPSEEVVIALAGPAVNLAIVLLLSPVVLSLYAAGLFDAEGLAGLAVTYIGAVWLGNGILMLFNMLPAFPMDEGRVLRATLSVWMPKLRATEIAAGVGLGLALLLGMVGLLTWHWGLIFVAGFVVFAGQMELMALRHAEAQAAAEDVPEVVLPGRLMGFTGLMWDADNRVWVRWVNGRPVGTA
jgi:Zn-dependent protease